MLKIAAATVLLVAAAGGASAQGAYEPGSSLDPYYGRQGDRICKRMCVYDRSPCDPVHWKTADARCSGHRRRWD